MRTRFRGFSLAEILVTLAIVAILVVLIVYSCMKLYDMVHSLKDNMGR